MKKLIGACAHYLLEHFKNSKFVTVIFLTLQELWSFNLDTLTWEMETVNRGRCHSELCGEIQCAGHTATVVQNRMIVIFGHSPKLGFLDTVQVSFFKISISLFWT